MRLVPVNELREGSEMATDIINNEGKLLLKRGQKVTKAGVGILEKLGVSYVYIWDEY